jgi:hypothetical protein
MTIELPIKLIILGFPVIQRIWGEVDLYTYMPVKKSHFSPDNLQMGNVTLLQVKEMYYRQTVSFNLLVNLHTKIH